MESYLKTIRSPRVRPSSTITAPLINSKISTNYPISLLGPNKSPEEKVVREEVVPQIIDIYIYMRNLTTGARKNF
jgi:hypothetical protein